MILCPSLLLEKNTKQFDLSKHQNKRFGRLEDNNGNFNNNYNFAHDSITTVKDVGFRTVVNKFKSDLEKVAAESSLKMPIQLSQSISFFAIVLV